MGKHSKARHQDRRRMIPKGMIEMVDAHTRQNHLVSLDAAAASRWAPHRCLARCGRQILPAALVEPGTGYCKSCRCCTVPIPRAGK